MVLSIFLLKAVFNYKESVVLEAAQSNPLGPGITAEEIAEKYAELPEE